MSAAMLGPLRRYAVPPIANRGTDSPDLGWVHPPSMGRPSSVRYLSHDRSPILSGLFSFRDAAQDPRVMPRYFFILAYSDQEMGDPSGVTAPATMPRSRPRVTQWMYSGQSLGRRMPKPTIFVKNEAGETIYRYPSN